MWHGEKEGGVLHGIGGGITHQTGAFEKGKTKVTKTRRGRGN